VLAEPVAAGAAAATATKPALRKLSELAPADDFFRSVAMLPQILDIAAELTQSAGPLVLYGDQAFLKPAFEGSEKPQHQDNSYFRITPHDAGVTCWIAVDDSTEQNGCMRYVPGSHKLGLLPHKSLTPVHLTPDVNFKLADEVAVPIPAGAAIFHHLLCLHSSRANTSPHSRRAWALHIANPAGQSPVKPWEQMMKLR
jgi:ectoine hydroxylase-related dioxygenase (phytanoyl-CoA dioxygenase family)